MGLGLVTVHVSILVCTAAVILYSDHQGFLYFRGKKEILSKSFLVWSHMLVWTGLLLMIFTGILLVLPSWTYRLQQPIFYVKMAFVLVLVVNAFAIGTLSRHAESKSFASLSKEEQRTLLISGALSFICWVGATTIGLLLVYGHF